LRPEPLQEPGRPRLKAWDGLVWGSIAALALVGINVFLATDRSPSKSPPTGSKTDPAPVVERSRDPARVMPVSTRTEDTAIDEGSIPEAPDRKSLPTAPRPSGKRRPGPGRQDLEDRLQTFK
jgi:hypothetical protein